MTIMVFTGSGASAFVNPDRFPTTVGLYKQLDNNIKNKIGDIGGGIISQQIQRRYGNREIDIERITWIINDFIEICENGRNSHSALFALINNLSPELIGLMGGIEIELASLDSSINKKIYETYGGVDFSEEEWRRISELRNFIEKIQNIHNPDKPHVIELFTTNYDLILDTILDEEELDIYDCKERFYNYKILNYPPPGELIKGAGRLTKLHGSIDWQMEGMWVVAKERTGHAEDKDINLLLGFGEKKDGKIFFRSGSRRKHERKYIVKFHDHLAEVVNRARAAVFIGYSFGDEAINDILSKINPDIPKCVINKNQGKIGLSFLDNAYYCDDGLSEAAMTDCILHIANSRLPDGREIIFS